MVFVPLSGLVSVNNVPDTFHNWSIHRFRPLIGVSFCKRAEEVFRCITKSALVFVPLSGLVSVNELREVNNDSALEVGFRPLIGVSFCKLISHYILFGLGDCPFSSPYRG